MVAAVGTTASLLLPPGVVTSPATTRCPPPTPNALPTEAERDARTTEGLVMSVTRSEGERRREEGGGGERERRPYLMNYVLKEDLILHLARRTCLVSLKGKKVGGGGGVSGND